MPLTKYGCVYILICLLISNSQHLCSSRYLIRTMESIPDISEGIWLQVIGYKGGRGIEGPKMQKYSK